MTEVARLWQTLSRPGQAAVVAFFLMTAGPPATNYSPGPWGYGWVFLLLVVGGCLLWRPARVRLTWVEWSAVALGAWVVASVAWGSGNRWMSLFAAVLAVLAAWVPRLLLAREPARVTLFGFVSAAGVVGSLVAAFPLMWVTGQGPFVWRPGLPIGGASNNALGLLLFAAGLLTMVRRDDAGRSLWLTLLALDVLLVVQSASRAGWWLLAVFGFVVFLRITRPPARGALGVAGAGALALGVLQYFVRGGATFMPDIRVSAALNALQIWVGSPWQMTVGQGGGRVWTWMKDEMAWRSSALPGVDAFVKTHEHGAILYHAHSTFVALLVERGVIGLALIALVLAPVTTKAARAFRRRTELDLVALGMLLTVPAMFVELYLLRSFSSAVLWWLTAWLILGDVSDRPTHQRAGRSAVTG